jgi:hypothetical protein
MDASEEQSQMRRRRRVIRNGSSKVIIMMITGAYVQDRSNIKAAELHAREIMRRAHSNI